MLTEEDPPEVIDLANMVDVTVEEETGKLDTRKDAERVLQSLFDRVSRRGYDPVWNAVHKMYKLREKELDGSCPACAGKGEYFCTRCYGTGKNGLKVCPMCEGTGRKKCPICNGSGKF